MDEQLEFVKQIAERLAAARSSGAHGQLTAGAPGSPNRSGPGAAERLMPDSSKLITPRQETVRP